MDGERITVPMRGMNDAPNADPGWAERIVNLTIDAAGAWRNCTDWLWLYEDAAAPTYPTAAVAHQSIFWWGQRGTARQWILWERATSATACTLEVFDGIAQTYFSLGSRQRIEGPSPGTTYLPIGGWLYLFNGYDAPVRWNGRHTTSGSELVQVGFDRAPPPLSASLGAVDTSNTAGLANIPGLASGVGAVSKAFRYGYAYTYVNDVGSESPPSSIVYVSGTNGANELYHIKLTWSNAPVHARAMRLYRTVDLANAPATAEGARFSLYHVLDFPSATSQSWDDGLPDALLGHELLTTDLGLYPTGARYAALFKGTLFLAGAPSYPDRVFYSAPGLVEQFPSANTFDLGGIAGAEIMGLHATQNALVILTRRGIHAIKGDPVNGFYLQTISAEVGCVSSGTVVDVPGESPAVMFFDVDGPYLLALSATSETSAKLEYIGDPISHFWSTEVNLGEMAGARSARHRRDEEIIFMLPTNGVPAATRQMGLVYHYRHGYWSLRDTQPSNMDPTSVPIGAMCEINDHRGLVAVANDYVYIGSGRLVQADATDGAVWLYRTTWVGPTFERSSIASVEILGHLVVYGTGNPTNRPFGIRVRSDRALMEELNFASTWASQTFDFTLPARTSVSMVETEYTVDTWNDSYWDAGFWQRMVPRVYPIDIVGRGAELQFELAAGGVPISHGGIKVAGSSPGPVVMTHMSFLTVGSPRQAKWGQQRGSERS
jgi:hypothetical protein